MAPVLKDLVVAVSGTHKGFTQAKIEKLVTSNGGKFAKAVDDSTTHLVSTEADVEKSSSKVKAATEAGAQLVSLEWLTDSIDAKKKKPEKDYLLKAGANTAPAAANASKKRAAAKSPDDDEEQEDTKPPAKKVKSTRGKGKAKKEPTPEPEPESESEAEEEKPQMKTVMKKGKAPVDETCPLAGSHHVFVDPDDDVAWDAVLNQADIGNNANKFYYCQLLESDTASSYAVYCHWGRVGERGQSKMYYEGSGLMQAKAAFEKQFKAKTGKSWDQRTEALGGAKKYAYLERNYEDSDDEDSKDATAAAAGTAESKEEIKSKYPKAIQHLTSLIFNTSYMEQSMAELSYDSRKLPLGKLSKDTITRGYTILKEISDAMDSGSGDLAELSSRYYTVIPHDFGRNRPTVISTGPLLKRELSLVENLGDMVITNKIMKDSKAKGEEHPLDKQFDSLKLDEAEVLDKASTEFQNLEAYLKKTHGHTHYMKLTVEDIFRVRRTSEETRWNQAGWNNYKNDSRYLLWHGSRTTNYAGILSQGLRIAPPEAPVNGYMFGKGVYLADIVSKSANYCAASTSGNTGLLLLCEAQLGDPMYERLQFDYQAAENCKKNGHIATKGVGTTAPQQWEDGSVVHSELKDVKIPKVTSVKDNITGPSGVKNASLQYNEYIAYDVSQIKLRYLFRCRFS